MTRIGPLWVLFLTLVGGCARAPDPAARQELNGLLFKAIREGKAAVDSLLRRGADANARDESGATVLMQAALNADAETLDLLLRRGAEVNAHNDIGATALHWALPDREKVKLLLDHGANANARAESWGHTPLMLAAKIAGARPTLELMRRAGADLSANNGGFTPLMAATVSGDLDNVKYLVEQGADVRAATPAGYTVLHAAGLFGDAEMVRYLLEHGADADARVEISHGTDDVGTPAIVAAMSGNVGILRPILEQRPDVNIQGGAVGRTALLCAATTGSAEAVRFLLASGASVNVEDSAGETALDWALKRGDDRIVRLLKEAGGQQHARQRSAPPTQHLQDKLDAGSVRLAVSRSLPLLQRSSQIFTDKKGCFSCHHQGLVPMTVSLARSQGFAVDEAIAGDQRLAVLKVLDEKRQSILLGFGVTDPPVPAFALAGLASEHQEPNATTDALVQHLMLAQRKDGRWHTPVYRPPHDASDFAGTALAVRVLPIYAAPGRAREVESRIARARAWLIGSKGTETEDQAFRLLGLGWAGAEEAYIEEAVAQLLHEQRPDGGWAQLPTLASDAYATGQVLYALHEGGKVSVRDSAYQRGVKFLLKTQLADGSWYVPSRSFPFQPYFNAGYPHGISQFISCAGSCWATMALASTEKDTSPKPQRGAPLAGASG
jgi:ankyrin repeat protein